MRADVERDERKRRKRARRTKKRKRERKREEEKVQAGAVIDDLCMCSIMIPVVACIALSELNTHIIIDNIECAKMCAKIANLHTFWHTLSA